MLKYSLTDEQEPYRMRRMDGWTCRSVRRRDNPDLGSVILSQINFRFFETF
jgi:hypothetical protein